MFHRNALKGYTLLQLNHINPTTPQDALRLESRDSPIVLSAISKTPNTKAIPHDWSTQVQTKVNAARSTQFLSEFS